MSSKVMGKYDTPIHLIKSCPECGSTLGYYQTMYASGYIAYNKLFEDGSSYNFGMYDYLKYSRESKYYKCMECHSKIAKVDNK